jgi:hypothetical protein
VEAVLQIKERRHPVYMLQALKSYMPREDYPEIDRIMQSELLKTDANAAQSGKGGDGRRAA